MDTSRRPVDVFELLEDNRIFSAVRLIAREYDKRGSILDHADLSRILRHSFFHGRITELQVRELKANFAFAGDFVAELDHLRARTAIQGPVRGMIHVLLKRESRDSGALLPLVARWTSHSVPKPGPAICGEVAQEALVTGRTAACRLIEGFGRYCPPTSGQIDFDLLPLIRSVGPAARIDGASIGLAAALTSLSLMIRPTRRIPFDVAVTGGLDEAGTVRQVDGLEEKLRVLLTDYQFVRRVLVPAGTQELISPMLRRRLTAQGTDVKPVETLGDACAELFGTMNASDIRWAGRTYFDALAAADRHLDRQESLVAKDLYTEVLEKSASIPINRKSARYAATVGLIECEMHVGKTTDALRGVNQALKESRGLPIRLQGNRPIEAVLSNAVVVCTDLFDRGAAQRYGAMARRVAKKHQDEFFDALTLSRLGQLELHLCNYERASKRLRIAQGTFTQPQDRARNCCYLAEAAIGMGHHAAAMRWIRESWSLIDKAAKIDESYSKDLQGSWTALSSAFCQYRAGKFSDALNDAHRALRLYERIGHVDPPKHARILKYEGLAKLNLGDPAGLDHIQEAIAALTDPKIKSPDLDLYAAGLYLELAPWVANYRDSEHARHCVLKARDLLTNNGSSTLRRHFRGQIRAVNLLLKGGVILTDWRARIEGITLRIHH